MISKTPQVSIIIPCLNECDYIGPCLDSLISFDFPKERLEVIVVDGLSDDGTREILDEYCHRWHFIKRLDNAKRITPAALNIGIRHSKGDVIIRLDAHSLYDQDYVSKCLHFMREYQADNVGGIWDMVPRDNSFGAKAVAVALSSVFGVGNAEYRTDHSPDSQPRWVKTVPYGCYRREIFDRIGLYDEDQPRNEDLELNHRLRKAGGRILLVPEIIVKYRLKFSVLGCLKHYFENGVRVTRQMRWDEPFFCMRHLTPLAFVSAILLILILAIVRSGAIYALWLLLAFYLAATLFFSAKSFFEHKDLRLLVFMPVMFFSLHVAYGAGSLWGLLEKAFPSRLRFWSK